MKITIKDKYSENICCICNPSDTVKELKTKIQEKGGLEIQQQHLILNGENYLQKNDIKLPDKFIPKIETLPKSPNYLKLFAHPENLPENYLSYALIEANDFDIYKEAFKSFHLRTPVFSTIDFWKHIMLLISSTEEEISEKLISLFAHCFEMNIDINHQKSIYNQLIFDDHLPNENQSMFLYEMLVNMGEDYVNNYILLFDKERFKKLLASKEIPCKELCKLFSFHNHTFSRQINPKELYIFEFSFQRMQVSYPNDLEVNFEPRHSIYETLIHYASKLIPFFNDNDNDNDTKNKLNDELLTQFIKQKNDLSLITSDIDEKTFIFIASALIFAHEKRSINVKGLTKNNALPFFAIAFNHLKDEKIMHFINGKPYFLNVSATEILDVFVESIKCLEDCTSSLLNESINAILSIRSDLFLYDCSHLNAIIEILCDFFVNGKYKADKMLLIDIILYLSNTNSPEFQQYERIFQKYGILLFNCIWQNKAELMNTKRNYYLNIRKFNQDEIQSFFENEFKKSTFNNDIFQIISFYVEYCINPYSLKIDNTTSITNLLQKFAIDEKWKELTIVAMFCYNNKINLNIDISLREKQISKNEFLMLDQITHFITIDDIIFQILYNPDVENDDNIMNDLFTKMMQDKSIAYKYIIASLDKISSNMVLDVKSLFEKPHLYMQYKDTLVMALKHSYAFHEEKMIFVKKSSIEPFKLPSFDCSFLNRLYEKKCYKSFVWLQNIASCFPFLFDPDSSNNLKVLDLVLPVFDCFADYYNDNQSIEEKTNNLKTAYSALSFLFSCLNSIKFISVFTIWLFENIGHLTDSQVIFMSVILTSLYKAESINAIILGYAMKYNFLDTLNDLLLREIKDTEFRSLYIQNLYILLSNHLHFASEISSYEYFILIDQIKNGSITNPFDLLFNYSTVLPETIVRKFIKFPKKNESIELIEKFYFNINNIKKYWLSQNVSQFFIESEYITDLLSFFEDEKYTFIEEKLPPILSPLTIKALRFLSSQINWAFDYLESQISFPLLSDQYSFLTQLVNQVNEIINSSKINPTDEDIKVPYSINPFEDKRLKDQVIPSSIFETILKLFLD